MSADEGLVVLVADDDDTVRLSVGELLETQGYRVAYARDGLECIERVRELVPHLLVLDLAMPRLDGFGVLDALPTLDLDAEPPDVIVLTGLASAGEGIRAMRSGAIGFLTKPTRATELFASVRRATEARESTAFRRRLFADSHKRWECRVPPDRANIRWVAQHLAAEMEAFIFDGDIRPRRVLLALDEALTNAIVHGALEVDSRLKEDGGAFETVVLERESDPAWARRTVTVIADFRPERLEVTVADPGRGFDLANLPDPSDPEAALLASGRGLVMMRALMDEVRFDDGGRSVRLAMHPVRRR